MNSVIYDFIQEKTKNGIEIIDKMESALKEYINHLPSSILNVETTNVNCHFPDLGIDNTLVCDKIDPFENGDYLYQVNSSTIDVDTLSTITTPRFILTEKQFYYFYDFILEYYPNIMLWTNFMFDEKLLEIASKNREKTVSDIRYNSIINTKRLESQTLKSTANAYDTDYNELNSNHITENKQTIAEHDWPIKTSPMGFGEKVFYVIMTSFMILGFIYTFIVLPIKDRDKPRHYREYEEDSIQVVHPSSSAIEQMDYNYDQNVLIISFVDGTYSYAYFDFPESKWREFKKAESKGEYFQEHIKDYYEYEKLD